MEKNYLARLGGFITVNARADTALRERPRDIKGEDFYASIFRGAARREGTLSGHRRD